MTKEEKIIQRIEAQKARLKKERVKVRKMEKTAKDRAFACFGEYFYEEFQAMENSKRENIKKSLLAMFEKLADREAIQELFNKLK